MSRIAAPRLRCSTKLAADILGGADVQPACRLGDDDHLGVAFQHPGQDHLLDIAAGEGADAVAGRGLDLVRGDQRLGVGTHPLAVERAAR